MAYTYGSISSPNDADNEKEVEAVERKRPRPLLRVVGLFLVYSVVVLILFTSGNGALSTVRGTSIAPEGSPTIQQAESKSILDLFGIRTETKAATLKGHYRT